MNADSANKGPSEMTVTVENSLGKATFVRQSRQDASLEIEYEIPALSETKNGVPQEEVVNRICQREVALMKQTLSGLATELSVRVSQHGKEPKIVREWKTRDERDWN